MIETKANGNILLTRGDSAKLVIDLTEQVGDEEKPYEMKEGEMLTFSIKKDARRDKACLLQKTSTTNEIILDPSDTEKLDFDCYDYGIKLITADGEKRTVLVAKFEIGIEV